MFRSVLPAIIVVLTLVDGLIHFSLDIFFLHGQFFSGLLNVLFLLNFGGMSSSRLDSWSAATFPRSSVVPLLWRCSPIPRPRCWRGSAGAKTICWARATSPRPPSSRSSSLSPSI
jgi:hypothetical protein